MKPPTLRLAQLRSRSRQQGSEIVEFALIAVFFFSIIFLIIETGWFIWQYNTVTLVAQEGARYGSLIPDVADSSKNPAILAKIKDSVAERLSALGQPGPYDLAVETAEPPATAPDKFLCVTITYYYHALIQFGPLQDLLNGMRPTKVSCMPIAPP